MEPLTRAEAVAGLKEIAARLGKPTVTREEFARETGLSLGVIHRRLPAFSNLIREAGLTPYRSAGLIPEEELLAALREALIASGGKLTRSVFDEIGRYNVVTYRARWGNWGGALAALAAWLEKNEPDFPYLPPLKARLTKGRTGTETPTIPIPADERAYGRMVGLPALLHAPLTENGVIYLFGAMAAELGFVVEAITAGYPDCLAKRRLDREGERWTRVRIEFEQASRNFRDHGHDPGGCDLIVCWKHNWSECPVEVLELKSVVSSPSCRT